MCDKCDVLKHDLEKLSQYFRIAEHYGGLRSCAAEAILSHFNDDGSLKGEGRWRGREIYRFVKEFIDADNQIGAKLNAIDFTLPSSMAATPEQIAEADRLMAEYNSGTLRQPD